jgi:hypothetical protein
VADRLSTLPLPVLLARLRAVLGQTFERRSQDWPHPRTLALPPEVTQEVLDDLLWELDAALSGIPRDHLAEGRAAALQAIRELQDYDRDQLLADYMARSR